jgi:hypothetical protein
MFALRKIGHAEHIKQKRKLEQVNIMTTSRPLDLLRMDLFDLVAYINIGESKYRLVIVDDYTCFT